MAPPNKFSPETTEKLKKISDEIGEITQKLLAAVENHHTIDPDDEVRLRDLKKELERISAHDGPDAGANLPEL